MVGGLTFKLVCQRIDRCKPSDNGIIEPCAVIVPPYATFFEVGEVCYSRETRFSPVFWPISKNVVAFFKVSFLVEAGLIFDAYLSCPQERPACCARLKKWPLGG